MLIVAPTSVLPNWQAEATRFAPRLSVLVLHGPDRHQRHGDIAAHDVVLTSYPLLVRDLTALSQQRFELVVFDEAHNLKNPRTASHAAAQALVAERKIALTGTPVENRLLDAWALFQIVTPGLLGSQRAFTREHRALRRARDRSGGSNAAGPQAEAIPASPHQGSGRDRTPGQVHRAALHHPGSGADGLARKPAPADAQARA